VGLLELQSRLQQRAEQRRLADLLRQDTDFANLIARLLLPSDGDTVEALHNSSTAVVLGRLAMLPTHVTRAVARMTAKCNQAQEPEGLAVGAGNAASKKFAMDTEDGEDGLRRAMFGDEMLYREEGLEGLIGRAVYGDMHTTYMHTYIHTYIHAHMHTCIHAYIHTYMHTCIHAYIHTYIHACILARKALRA